MKIGIGIPIFQTLEPQVALDYMRMWYSFGRRYQEHDFFLISRTKSEQFRARNAIVETALKYCMDYLLFLDDDQIINWQGTPESTPYEFLHKLLNHKKDIIGALYYHRTGDYRPVLMKKLETGGYRFLNDNEITGGLQEVDVQGGGCMLIDMKIFDKIKPPYFEPEQQTVGKNLGTDIQLCKKAKENGFSVWSDTSIVVGHLKQESEVVTHMNRDSFMSDNSMKAGMVDDWVVDSWLKSYKKDVKEYTGFSDEEIIEKAMGYNEQHFIRFGSYENKDDYYKSIGIEQLCRQVWYHGSKRIAYEGLTFIKRFKSGNRLYGIDYGCGSAPVGFKLIKMGHQLDFVDIDGAAAYEFLKWRVKKHNLDSRVGWEAGGPYDFALFLDSIEHLCNWDEVLDNIIGRIKEGGVLLTNYFSNNDYNNTEHVNMDKQKVMDFLLSRNMVPRTMVAWVKDDNYMGGAMVNKEAVNEQTN